MKRGEGGQNTSDPTGPDAISEYWKQARKVVVTGCCGTLGRRLVRRLLDPEYVFRGAILGIDNNEDGIFRMEARWTDEPRARFLLGDVRDQSSLRRLFAGADTVLHCAAYKHVYQCEKAPFEAMRTNILGVESVIQAASEVGVSRVLFTSSDKAVNPTNVMGTSKLMGERLITAANANGGGAVFASTRFGNVLGSRGSVTEIFASQIARGGPLTLTSSEMTRFVMSIDEAVRLVLSSVPLARGGDQGFGSGLQSQGTPQVVIDRRHRMSPGCEMHGGRPAEIAVPPENQDAHGFTSGAPFRDGAGISSISSSSRRRAPGSSRGSSRET